MSGIRGVNATKPGAPIKPERPGPPVKFEKPVAPPAASSSASSAPGPPPAVQEYVVRVPKTSRKKINVMRFNANLGIDCGKWNQTHVKMERENNMRDFKGIQDDMPKFGAGSEFGREAREEARRKKYGIISKKYKPEDQPWLMRIGGKSGKRFKGTREGGVTENASYYVFTQAPDGAFEAYPVSEWYNFQPIQRFKALSAEEAEEEFGRRNKIFNYFSVMVRKRLKADDGEEEEDGEGGSKPKGKKKGGDSGMDGDEKDGSASSDDEEGNSDEEGGSKSKKKKAGKKKPKKKKDSDDEANEDSDDGDEEGREVDYMSSSESEDDVLDDAKLGLKGVAEEDALRKLLNSDEESEDEEKKENEEEEQEEDPDAAANKAEKEDKTDGKKKKKDKSTRKNDYGSSDSDMGSSDSEDEKLAKPKANKAADASTSKQESPGKSTENQAEKRKGEPLTAAQSAIQAAKKARMDGPSTSSLSPLPAGATEGVTEESVRRYLARKPMTTTELLQKFKSKKTGLTSEQMVHHVAQILKRINPTRQTIKGKMYLSLKS